MQRCFTDRFTVSLAFYLATDKEGREIEVQNSIDRLLQDAPANPIWVSTPLLTWSQPTGEMAPQARTGSET